MRKITLAALALAGSMALVGVTAVPAFAATGDTPVSVTVASGVISITVPGTKALTAALPGATSTTTLGDTVVTDGRAGTAGWIANVTLPVLTGTVTSTNATIPTTGATYAVTTATKTGTVTVTAAATITGLGTAKTSQTATAVSGNNTATWAATLTVPMPAQVLADTYSGTLTQSVS